MYCQQCGKQLPDGIVQCESCLPAQPDNGTKTTIITGTALVQEQQGGEASGVKIQQAYFHGPTHLHAAQLTGEQITALKLKPIGRKIPPSIGTYYVGKSRNLAPLREHFIASDGARNTSVPAVALVANGGYGKSRVAIEYAHLAKTAYETQILLNAASLTLLQENLSRVAISLGMSSIGKDQAELSQNVLDALSAYCEDGLLVIFDGVDDVETAEYVKTCIRTIGLAHIIITTRIRHWGKTIRSFSIDLLSEPEAIEMLYTGMTAPQGDSEAPKNVARLLGYLPLALETASAYIRLHGLAFEEYKELLNASPQKALDWSDQLDSDYPATVWNAFRVTWQEIERQHPHAWTTLKISALFATAPIPIAWFPKDISLDPNEVGGELAAELNSYNADECLNILHRYCQIERPQDERGFFSLHAVIRQILRAQWTGEEGRIVGGAALGLLWKFSMAESANPSSWLRWEILRPHLESVVEFAFSVKIVHPCVWMLVNLGSYLLHREETSQALLLFRRAAKAVEAAWGEESGEWICWRQEPQVVPMYLECLLGLSKCLRLAGDTENAMQVLGIAFNNMPDGDEDNLPSRLRLELAEALLAKGSFIEAEGVLTKLLSDANERLGAYDLFISASLRVLHKVYMGMDNYDEAERVLRRACRIDARWRYSSPAGRVVGTPLFDTEMMKRIGGPLYGDVEDVMDHDRTFTFSIPKQWKPRYAKYTPPLAEDLMLLSDIRMQMGENAKAYTLLTRALCIFWYSYGPMHPATHRAWVALYSLGVLVDKIETLPYSAWVTAMAAYEVHSFQSNADNSRQGI